MRRALQLRIRVLVQNESRTTTSHRYDLAIQFGEGSTVGDLVSALVQKQVLRTGPTWSLRRELVRAGDAKGVGMHAHGYLDANSRIVDHGLVEGSILEAVTNPTDCLPMKVSGSTLELGESEFFLVDEVGTAKGRITPLPDRTPVSFSCFDREADVMVNELSLGSSRMVFTRCGDEVQLEFDSQRILDRVLVNGQKPTASGHQLLPGARVAIVDTTDEDQVRAEWSVGTGEFLNGKSPFGRVPLEPRSRPALKDLPILPQRSERITRKPREPRRPDFPIEGILLPGLLGVAMATLGGSWWTLALAPIMIIPVGIQYRRSLRQHKEQHELAVNDWVAKTRSAIGDQTRMVGEHEDVLVQHAPASDLLRSQAFRRRSATWGRSISDRNFMSVRVGVASMRSHLQIEIEPGEDLKDERLTDLMAEGLKQVSDSKLVPWLNDETPVIVDLLYNNLAVVGPSSSVLENATDIVVQLACAHSPGALVMAALLPATESGDSFDWLAWLPQLSAPSPLLPLDRIARGRDVSNRLLREVLKTLDERTELRQDEPQFHALLIVHEAAGVDLGLLNDALGRSGGALHVLWLGSSRDGAPQLTKTVLEIPSDHLRDANAGEPRATLRMPSATIDDIRIVRYSAPPDRIALNLAPLIDPRVFGSNASVPTEVLLSSMLDIESSAGAHLTRATDSSNRLVTKLGKSAIDHDLAIDLAKDGPHMLVGGTTGSGKSEFLRSLVAGLAASYPPTEVSFFLVDYKGGQTFSPVADGPHALPHLTGFISDLDGPNISRAIKFLQSEIRYRLKAFAAAGNAKDYPEYRQHMRGSSSVEPYMPRLIIVFDEFHALIRQTSEGGTDDSVLRAVEDIAQRGRSLGIHLVLATQRPSSQIIRADTRANIRAQVALATLSKDDSELIIGVPDAAQIPRSLPGRALLNIGEQNPVEFQSPYSGLPYRRPVEDETNLVTVRYLSEAQPISARDTDESGTEDSTPRRAAATELAHLASIIHDQWAPGTWHTNVRRLTPSLLESPERYHADSSGAALVPTSTTQIDVGVIDIPSEQRISPLTIDFDSGMVHLTGPSKTGKTHALVNIAERWLAVNPDGNVYALDAEGALTNLALGDRHHTSWYIVEIRDAAAVTRLIDQLTDAAVKAQLSAEPQAPPRLVIIDGFERLERLFANEQRSGLWAERFVDLVQYGSAANIHIAVASVRENLDPEFKSSVGTTIRLGANFSAHNLPREDWLPGYGLNDQDQLAQLYMLDTSPAAYAAAAEYQKLTAPSFSDLRGPAAETAAETGQVYFGVDDVSSMPIAINLTQETLIVSGRSGTGRSNVLHVIARQISEVTDGGKVIYYGNDPTDSGSAFYLPWQDDLAKTGETSPERSAQSFKENLERYAAAHRSILSTIGGRLVMCVDEEDTRSMDPTSSEQIMNLARRGELAVVFAVRGNTAPQGLAGTPVFRERQRLLYMSPNPRAAYSAHAAHHDEPLLHRPRTRYITGQGVYLGSEGQRYIWIPRLPIHDGGRP